uniref:Helix-turn-helix domain-containing protein n=1 Tax=Mycena chlorophos TaxID=658473 RepID=A0ABQ0LGD8_MYCCL|nr:predicted protein [Mycena chlorophos]
MRPIVPCHSAIQNPAAKYISKKLKPLIEAAPTIIHGTKDLAIKLSKVKLQPKRQIYIVTGDVVAFYPHVPLEPCLDIVEQLYYEFKYADYGVNTLNDDELHEHELFLEALRVANENLVMQFESKYYRQKQGLAMGVADAPDLANLYGWFFERKVEIYNHPLVPFYGRYIDDCFALVYAHSEAEAIQIISSQIHFDGCTIEWNASNSSQVFLDMRIYIDYDGSIQHMPYRKMRSHQERIPWISHHPLDVKRGTFIGEMSRLATLSSKRSHYTNAIKDLVALYIKRGYPQVLVERWTRDNILERWSKRLNVHKANQDEPGEVLVLKSTFNSAWNYFSSKELGDTILGFWREWTTRAENGNQFSLHFPPFSRTLGSLRNRWDADAFGTMFHVHNGTEVMPDIRKIGILNRRLIVSRKRTKNLFDLTSLWKKLVISKLEQDASARRQGNPARDVDPETGEITLHHRGTHVSNVSHLLD